MTTAGGVYILVRRYYVSPHFQIEIRETSTLMRNEMINVTDEIKQAISLLRRHL